MSVRIATVSEDVFEQIRLMAKPATKGSFHWMGGVIEIRVSKTFPFDLGDGTTVHGMIGYSHGKDITLITNLELTP